MKTQIFAYKNNLGATTDIEGGTFINDIKGPGQLGCVVSTSEIQISAEAKELIRKASREGGSFAEIMLTKHSDDSAHGKSSIGLMGFRLHHFGEDFNISRNCELSVLEDCEEVVDNIPQDYKDFIDKNE